MKRDSQDVLAEALGVVAMASRAQLEGLMAEFVKTGTGINSPQITAVNNIMEPMGFTVENPDWSTWKNFFPTIYEALEAIHKLNFPDSHPSCDSVGTDRKT